MASFKQQCPSCEALVPIRDEGLIGRKIDCPKCKYRFLVEAPPEEEEDLEEQADVDAASKGSKKGKADGKKPGDKKVAAGKDKTKPGKRKNGDEEEDAVDGKPPSKKQAMLASLATRLGMKGGKKQTNMLMIGGGLAAAAVVLLGLALYFMMGGSSASTAKGSSSSPPVAGVRTTTPDTPAKKDGKEPDKPAVSLPVSLPEIANLLPNDSETIFNFSVEKMLNSSLKQVMLKSQSQARGVFNPKSFQDIFGFAFEDISRILIGFNHQKKTIFTIVRMRTDKQVPDDFIARLNVAPQEQINARDYYVIERDLDPLSNLFLKGNMRKDKLALHVLDPQTLVFADLGPMQKFLEDNCMPQQMEQPMVPDPSPMDKPPEKKTDPPPQDKTTTGTPGPPAGKFRNQLNKGNDKAPDKTPEKTPDKTAEQPADIPVVENVSWLTIRPELKLILDKLDNPETPTICFGAGDVRMLLGLYPSLQDHMTGQPTEFEKMLKLAEPLFPVVEQFGTYFGVSLRVFREDRLGVSLALAADNDKGAEALDHAIKPLLPEGATPQPSPMPNGPMNQGMGNVPMNLGMRRGGRPAGGLGVPAGSPNQPTTPTPAPPTKDDKYSLVLRNKTLIFSANIPLRDEEYDHRLENFKTVMIFLRGEAEMIDTRFRIYDLASATQAYLKAKGSFPRGTLPREAPDLVAPAPPVRRLSWMVELLPYVSNGDFKELPVNPEKSWQEGVNLSLGQLVVPEFIARGKTVLPYWVKYPGSSHRFAATHYVGIAGVGLDAPYYQAKDPATAKKLGIFGYDRAATPADVKDGLNKTILLIQVPADHKAPWIAGGGATVRGVAETVDCFKPFVSTEYKGKKGTFAIMADGKVRFLSESIAPEVFRALCTMNGGEPIEKLDAIAPEVPQEKAAVLVANPKLKANAPKDPPKPGSNPDQPEPAPRAPEANADPHESLDTLISEATRLLEAKEYAKFVQLTTPREQLTKSPITPDVVKAFEGGVGPLTLKYYRLMKTEKPSLSADGMKASFKLKDGDRTEVFVFQRAGKLWYSWQPE